MSYHMQAIVRTIITNEKFWIFSTPHNKKKQLFFFDLQDSGALILYNKNKGEGISNFDAKSTFKN